MYKYKSEDEEYFSYYCDELKAQGFIKEFGYEVSKFDLSPKYSRSYLKAGKRKELHKEEHIYKSSSITADLTIIWTKKAENIFYLNPLKPIHGNVKDIPFRLVRNTTADLISCIEVKPIYEGSISSSISFPLKMKQLQYQRGIYIQKIKPFSRKDEDCLFQKSFTPLKVIALEKYKRDTNTNSKGDSKLRYKVRTLEVFLRDTVLKENKG